MENRTLILGGGFRGLVCAFLLAKNNIKVSVIEAGGKMGGVLNSLDWDGLKLDLGCHLFDNTNVEITKIIVEMAGGEHRFHDVNLNYGSITENNFSKDVSVVDFSNLDNKIRTKYINEIRQQALTKNKYDCVSLHDKLVSRFCVGLAERLSPIIRKVYTVGPSEIDQSGINLGLFKRIKITDDKSSLKLKREPYFDEVLAASSASSPKQFYPNAATFFARNFYPASGGMGGFIEDVVSTLKNLDVDIMVNQSVSRVDEISGGVVVETRSGESFSGNKLISTLSPTLLEELLLGEKACDSSIYVPLLLIYAKVRPDDVGNMTYIHDFNPDNIVFRASTPGLYGMQRDLNGLTYVCVECPTKLNSSLWTKNMDQIKDSVLREMINLGILKENSVPLEWKLLKIEKGYRLPKPGSENDEKLVLRKFEKFSPKVFQMPTGSFSKNEIIGDLLKLLEQGVIGSI